MLDALEHSPGHRLKGKLLISEGSTTLFMALCDVMHSWKRGFYYIALLNSTYFFRVPMSKRYLDSFFHNADWTWTLGPMSKNLVKTI